MFYFHFGYHVPIPDYDGVPQWYLWQDEFTKTIHLVLKPQQLVKSCNLSQNVNSALGNTEPIKKYVGDDQLNRDLAITDPENSTYKGMCDTVGGCCYDIHVGLGWLFIHEAAHVEYNNRHIV